MSHRAGKGKNETFIKKISITYYVSLFNDLLSHFEKFDDVLHPFYILEDEEGIYVFIKKK